MAKKTVSKASEKYNGTKDKDEITISASKVTVAAKEGNDVIKFTKGDSGSISGDAGNDTFSIGKSAGKENKFYGGAGKDTFNLNGGSSNIIKGGDDVDTFTISSTIGTGNKIYGDAGNDVFTIKGGASNSYDGGTGNDRFTITSAIGKNNTVVGGAGADNFTIKGGSSNTFKGGSDDDVFEIMGGSGNIVYGEAGNDRFFIGGKSSVSINAGLGNNELVSTSGTVTEYVAGAGNDTIEAIDTGIIKSASLGNGKNKIRVYGGTITKAVTGTGVDEINVENGKITNLYAGDGADNITIKNTTGGTYRGEAGNDTIYMGRYAGNTTISGGAGNDTIGISGAQPKMNNGEILNINGDDGNDTIRFNGSVINSITGGNGADKILGYGFEDGSYVSTIHGNEGNDLIGFEKSTDFTINIDEDDIYNSDIHVYSGPEMSGRFGNIYGDNGDDIIGLEKAMVNSVHGGEGNDKIFINRVTGTVNGDNGDDIIYVAGGAYDTYEEDVLSINGGAGNDIVFVYINEYSKNAINVNLGAGTDFAALTGRGKINLVTNTGTKKETIYEAEQALISIDASASTTNKVNIINDLGTLNYKGSKGTDIISAKDDMRPASLYDINYNSRIYTGDGNDYIEVAINGENNIISAENGNDTIIINEGRRNGNNKVSGGNGNDTIKIFGEGFNLYGDAGKDTFLFAQKTGSNTLRDYENGEIIRLSTDISNLALKNGAINLRYSGNNVLLGDTGITITDGAFKTMTIQTFDVEKNAAVKTYTVKGNLA